jgi:invasion protein IalB
LADTAPSEALLQQLRRQNEAAQVRFVSGEGRENTLPLSLRGIAAALDAFAREAGR